MPSVDNNICQSMLNILDAVCLPFVKKEELANAYVATPYPTTINRAENFKCAPSLSPTGAYLVLLAVFVSQSHYVGQPLHPFDLNDCMQLSPSLISINFDHDQLL